MVEKHRVETSLMLEFDMGFDGDKQILKRKTYSKVKSSATDSDIHATGIAIGSLQKNTLNGVFLKATEELEEQE